MNLSELKPAKNSLKKKKRIGRGQGSGKGGTSTRGHKGAKSRSGYSIKAGFEGGQMPLQRRVPKFGFRNPNRVEYKILNLSDIQELASKFKIDSISVEFLSEHGYKTANKKVKILGDGELESKLTVEANAFSSSAKEKIEAKGGTASVV